MEKLKAKENPICNFWKILWAFAFSTGTIALIVSFFSLNTGLEGMSPPFGYATFIFGLAAIMPIYTLPAYFAHRKRSPKRKGVTLWNLLAGWTVIGYIICVIYVRTRE